jgi:hypothetical protein
MNIWLGIAATVALLLVAVVAAFVLIGPERFWNLFGPPDLGPISFETLKRRSTLQMMPLPARWTSAARKATFFRRSSP